LPFIGGNKGEWRQNYQHFVSSFGTIFRLRMDLDAKPPEFGFDHATSRLGQPAFLATRRRQEDSPPQVLTYLGGALNAELFLKLSGYQPVFKPQTSSTSRIRGTKKLGATKAVPSVSDAPRSLVERALAAAGMLGPVLANGARSVLCPWRHFHTSRGDWDTSTVVFYQASTGYSNFHCSHTHCAGRKAVDVLRALPSYAVTSAMKRGNP
jgi:hypothetical protein